MFISCCAVAGQGIKELVERIKDTKISEFNFNDLERWNEIGSIINQVQKITRLWKN